MVFECIKLSVPGDNVQQLFFRTHTSGKMKNQFKMRITVEKPS